MKIEIVCEGGVEEMRMSARLEQLGIPFRMDNGRVSMEDDTESFVILRSFVAGMPGHDAAADDLAYACALDVLSGELDYCIAERLRTYIGVGTEGGPKDVLDWVACYETR